MRDLSISQEYYLCAVNEKGSISSFAAEKLVCLVASALLDMKLADCIEIENKRVQVIGDLPEELSFLDSLYDFIHVGKPVKVEKILEEYNYSITDKRLKRLMADLGRSMEEDGITKEVVSGLFGGKSSYVPNQEAVELVIDKVRAEMLEEGTVTEEVAALIVLLDISKSMKYYFSKYEQKKIKEKLERLLHDPSGKMVKGMVDYIQTMMTMSAILLTVYN